VLPCVCGALLLLLPCMLLGTLLSLVVCATLQEFADCLTVNGDATKCGDLREDYFECLHHNKEVRGALSLPLLRAAGCA
jgi:hypothetical protein